ncbi:GNAT family N-acetyltransferase [Galactobacter valiniphilus]|uniref:GNAT family N-acetyltransferase n=1 Tax=Galactobacter valiniphilus TaxID=2676122 RepID=UPI0037360A94
MDLQLVALPIHRFLAWMERSAREYEADLLRLGHDAASAAADARKSLALAFPDGSPAAGQAVFDLVAADGEPVGYLWVGPDSSGDPTQWWVWDVVVDEAHRGKGYGKQAMRLAEEHARGRGATSIGLSVFGFNKPAQGLYESLGFETTSIKMRKWV